MPQPSRKHSEARVPFQTNPISISDVANPQRAHACAVIEARKFSEIPLARILHPHIIFLAGSDVLNPQRAQACAVIEARKFFTACACTSCVCRVHVETLTQTSDSVGGDGGLTPHWKHSLSPQSPHGCSNLGVIYRRDKLSLTRKIPTDRILLKIYTHL
jgi:hypothetical protein